MGYTRDGIGHRNADTSVEAAESMSPHVTGLQADIYRALKTHGPMTADQCARKVNVSILSARPRLTELKTLGLIEDSGVRGKNDSGRNAIVFRVKGAG